MDSYSDHATTLVAPARNAAAVVPSDTNDLAQVARGLFIGQAGDVAVVMADGATVIFPNVQAGSLLPLRVTRVRSSGTTATGLVAVW